MRMTGKYHISRLPDESVRAFVPAALPPSGPPLVFGDRLAALHAGALGAIERLTVAGAVVPSADWFLYGFVRKEAVISSRIEGTQATLRDVVIFEATRQADRPEDVLEICNYVDALNYARGQVRRPKGLPLSTRLLCGAHKRLMRGSRGEEKQPGEIRKSQNWIGGSRPGNARFVPPPPEVVPQCMGDLERWLHADDPLPPLVRAGLAHVQFETIHPFLDGNGRIGRLLITLLLEHWGLMRAPLLYLSVALRRRQEEYYQRLSAVRTGGDWEGWTAFFLDCVREAADDGAEVARNIYSLLEKDRRMLLKRERVTVPSIRLLDFLPLHPVITVTTATKLLRTTKPTATKAIAALQDAGILRETTGRQRDRAYAYQRYLDVLTGEDG